LQVEEHQVQAEVMEEVQRALGEAQSDQQDLAAQRDASRDTISRLSHLYEVRRSAASHP
jgi:hypothetical protein